MNQRKKNDSRFPNHPNVQRLASTQSRTTVAVPLTRPSTAVPPVQSKAYSPPARPRTTGAPPAVRSVPSAATSPRAAAIQPQMHKVPPLNQRSVPPTARQIAVPRTPVQMPAQSRHSNSGKPVIQRMQVIQRGKMAQRGKISPAVVQRAQSGKQETYKVESCVRKVGGGEDPASGGFGVGTHGYIKLTNEQTGRSEGVSFFQDEGGHREPLLGGT